jgi:uncharacterized repeat protein (TIGR03803 family)
VFEILAGTNTITLLAAFNGANGANPHGSLIVDSSGNLFGTTSRGGILDAGTVFEFQKSTDTLVTLATFDGTYGADPEAGLFEDQNGNLLGVASQGGAGNAGTVFEVQTGSNLVKTLASFHGYDGAHPL